MKTKLLFALSLVILVISCGGGSTAANYFVGFSGDVYEFTTTSGRSCVYANLGSGGGLSCNWN